MPKLRVIDQAALKVPGEVILPAGEGHQMVIVNYNQDLDHVQERLPELGDHGRSVVIYT